ncbi:hypothetical protein ERJ75_001282000 [Trypanosoma vivax]|nr:hypothetical protein ERJ75_001282000 [Trypanosoma vivax]
MLTRDGEDLVRSSAAEVVREVDGLYPQEDVSTFPQPPLPVTVVGVEKDEVSRAIRRRLTRGAAPGLDGWTRELLYPLTQDSALLMEVTVLTADILNGNVSEQMAHRLRATALTILRKPNGKYRPIGAESVWRSWRRWWHLIAWWRRAGASLRACSSVLVGRSSWRLRACGRTLRRRAVWRRWTGRTRTTPSAGRRCLRRSLGSRSCGRRGRWCSCFWAYPAWWACTMAGAWCTRGRRRAACARAWCLARSSFRSAPLPRCGACRRSCRTPFVAYLDDVTVAAAPEHLEAACGAAAQAMEELGIKNNAAKMEVLDPTCLSGFGDARRLTCARVLGAFVECDAAHEAEVTEAVDKRARETERLFRAILECPLAARTRWRLLSASALPRLTFLLRNHAAKHTRGAAEWFDARVTAVLSAIVGRPVSQRARDVAALPIAMGGCGLRRQVTIAEFAHECVGHKNLQRSKTEEADRDLSNALFATVYGAERQVLTANAAAGAGRALTDPQVCTDDAAFCTYVLERLLERVLPDGQKCVCGADASNWHVHTCTKLHGKPRQLRHDVANSKLALGLRLCGFDCTTEPHLNEVSKRRPDLLITGLGTQAVTDVTVTHPAVHPRGGKRSDSHSGIMTYEEAQAVYNPVHSAKVRYQEKCRKYAHWASQNGLNFAPLCC